MNRNELKSTFWLMIAMGLLLLIAVATGCRTQKSSVCDSAFEMQQQKAIRHEAAISEDKTTNLLRYITNASDSMRLVLTADSVTIPDGTTIYSPRIDSQRYGGRTFDNTRLQQTETRELSITEQDSISEQYQDKSNYSEKKDVTAIAKPPNMLISFLLIFAVCFVIHLIRKQ